jgi:hypothetical protein
MTDIEDRARAALDGLGEPGMYDDYDQACQWSGIVRDLIAALEEERESHAETAEIMRRARDDRDRWKEWHAEAVNSLEYYSPWFINTCCYPVDIGDDPRADLAKHLSRLQ